MIAVAAGIDDDIALGVPHESTGDDYYQGQFIPKGTCVVPNLTALNRNPERYHDPERFEPDRFKDHHLDAGAAATQADYGQRDHFNYGFGRRLCPGIQVAEQSFFMVVSRLLWAFEIRAKPGHPLDMSSQSGPFFRFRRVSSATDNVKQSG